MQSHLGHLLTYQPHEKKIEVPKVVVPPPPPKIIPNSYTLFFDGSFKRGARKDGVGLLLLNPNGEMDMEAIVLLTKYKFQTMKPKLIS